MDMVTTDVVCSGVRSAKPWTGAPADPITAEVVRHALQSGAEQMQVALCRTAYSNNIYEVFDLACGLYDRQIRLLAQSRGLPLFLGTLGFVIESTLAVIGGEEVLEPGDVLINTYAFHTGSHCQDVTMIQPAFVGGRLVGYAAVKAHHVDLGAKEPYCTDTTDNFQEGTIFPGVRLCRRGELVDDIYRTFVANSRMPDYAAGDLHAQMTAAQTGVGVLTRLVERYGHEQFEAAIERIFDHSEAMMRRYLERIPDGRYVGDSACDGDGVVDARIPFECVVEVAGSDITVDVTMAPPATRGPINCPLPSTVSCVRLAIVSALGSQVEGLMVNEGHLRPIRVLSRPGTLFHPLPPAPVYTYGWSLTELVDAVQKALAQPLADELPAGCGGGIQALVLWGFSPQRGLWTSGQVWMAGQGATRDGDGETCASHIVGSGSRNFPAETLELRAPLLEHRRTMIQDSGGVGRHTGSLGVEYVLELLEPTYFTPVFERTSTPPWALQGGGEGRPAELEVTLPDGTSRRYVKATAVLMPPGTVVRGTSGGGGGYGPPSERDPARVHADLREGYISEAAARRHYPHAFTGGAK